MLMDIKCSMVPSIAVNLRFDDQSEKHAVVSVGDLVDVIYNANGCRKEIQGKVIKVNACGEDPRSWYIIVDGSDDFESQKAKFSPMSILDIEILRKADTLNVVQTVIGDHAVPYLRIVHGRLQWSIDSFNWMPIVIDDRNIIEDQEGTVPIVPPPCPPPHQYHHHHRCDDETVCGCNDDDLEDANY